MNPELHDLLENLVRGFQSPLFNLGAQPITLLWLGEVTLLLFAVGLVAKGSKWLLRNRLLIGLGISAGNREVISTIAGLAVGAIGCVLVLQGKGLNLESFALIMGGLGIGVGFGLQELTKNLVSGITLLGERKLKVGDLVDFNGKMGFIQEISIRSTVIRTFHGSELIVPNTELTNNQIENWSYTSSRGRIDIPVQVEYGSDPVLVTELLLQSAYLEESVLTEPAPRVIFQQFGESGLDFQLWVWVDQIDRSLTVRSSLNFIIEYHFRRHGIRVPFRQTDFWLRNTEDLVAALKGETLRAPLEQPERQPLGPTLRDLLLRMPYFEYFDDLQVRGLIELGHRRRLEHGEIFIRQGDYHHTFCIVLTGAIDAFYENKKVSRRLFTFHEGDYFGELPLLLKIPYPTTMRAIGNTTLFVIGADGFHYLLNHYPQLKQAITEELAKRQENIQICQQTLREMGLLDDDHVGSPVTWLRHRLSKILGTNV